MTNGAAHWQEIYATKSTNEVSWYQRLPSVSFRLITSVSAKSSAVVDVGSGASLLADSLLAFGYEDVTLVDISQNALDEVANRVSESASVLHFETTDVLGWNPLTRYDVWHDRAVFHFLTESEQRLRYVDVAAQALVHGGALVIGAFAEDGPTQCSGLPVVRYSSEQLRAAFAPQFSLESTEIEEHITPSGAIQRFTWVVLRKK